MKTEDIRSASLPATPQKSGLSGFDDMLLGDGQPKRLLDYVFFQASEQVGQEQAQGLARIIITALVTICLLVHTLFFGGPWDTSVLGIVYGLVSLVHYYMVSRYRDRMLWRRYLSIAADMVMAGYLLYRLGISGLVVYPIFLWVVIGNGLRFGPHYLRVASGMGLAIFLVAAAASGLASEHPGVVAGMLVGLALMPKFFLVMLERLANVNRALLEQRNQAEHMATHDALTGLPNRLFLGERLAQAIAKAKRLGGTGGVAFLDLDGFKAINDNYGHDYGDLLLREVANCLRGRLRASDTVARLGGDEFILLIEDCKVPSDVVAAVEQAFSCLQRQIQIGEYQVYVTCSCGITLFPQDSDDPQTLVRYADTAMYRAKEAGRNRFSLYDLQMSEAVAVQMAVREELRQAIEADQLRVYYQPIVEMPSCRIVGAEALVRWQHPLRGLVGPADFITVAEQSGLIIGLGNKVLDLAVADATAWVGRRPGDFRLHVNISALQLLQPGFTERVADTLQRHGLPAVALELEMTESVLIDDAVKSGGLFDRLHVLGVGISLDDFGTGYSSLAYLKCLPVDHIKIDRSFVKDVPDDLNACALLEATFAFGHRLGIEVIAEGVETEMQLAWLTEHACRCMQGYYFGRPMPASAFHVLLQSQADLSNQSPTVSR